MTYPNIIECFHTGERHILEKVVHEGVRLDGSKKDREWLGHGIYFFAFSMAHAERWWDIGNRQGWWVGKPPAIMRAEISLGNCLDLQEPSGVEKVKLAAKIVLEIAARDGKKPLMNERRVNGLPVVRRLDCAVINMVHLWQDIVREPPYDTVIGSFQDGSPIYKGGTFRRDTHTQICVRNAACIANPTIVRV